MRQEDLSKKLKDVQGFLHSSPGRACDSRVEAESFAGFWLDSGLWPFAPWHPPHTHPRSCPTLIPVLSMQSLKAIK